MINYCLTALFHNHHLMLKCNDGRKYKIYDALMAMMHGGASVLTSHFRCSMKF